MATRRGKAKLVSLEENVGGNVRESTGGNLSESEPQPEGSQPENSLQSGMEIPRPSPVRSTHQGRAEKWRRSRQSQAQRPSKSQSESPCQSQSRPETPSQSPSERLPEIQVQNACGDISLQVTPHTEPERLAGSPRKREAEREIIVYVHGVSPMKRNRQNTMNYCNLKLQSNSGVKPAVCFSRSKRSLLVGRAETKTAVKLEKFNLSKDGKTIFINDITKMSPPNSSEYDFQHQDLDNNAKCLKTVAEDAVDMDVVNIKAKVICKESEPTVVGASNLRKSECYIADESSTIKLVLWEKNIEDVSVGEVYVFKNIRVRGEQAETKVLNTTVDTVIERTVDSELQQLVVNDIPSHDTCANSKLKVDLIHSVQELSCFKQCSHCSKKIIQDTCGSIVKCDHCGHVVRSSSCKVNVIVKFTVAKSDVADDSDDKFFHFVMFKQVLEKLVGCIDNLGDDCIFEKLLSLENFEISFNAEHIVKDATLQS